MVTHGRLEERVRLERLVVRIVLVESVLFARSGEFAMCAESS